MRLWITGTDVSSKRRGIFFKIIKFYNVGFLSNILILKTKVRFLETLGPDYPVAHIHGYRITEISATSMRKRQN